MNVTARLVHHDHYPETWHHYQLSAPVLCGWLRTENPVTDLVIAHVQDPVDGRQITLVTCADPHGDPDVQVQWRTLDGDQVTPTDLVRWILTRHGSALPQKP